LILALGWLGCAADTSEPTQDGDPTEPASAPSTNAPGGGSERPPFETTIPDAPPPPDTDPGPQQGESCADKDDPGSSESVAKALAATDDCDNAIKTVNGIANGPIDVDFYKLSATDKTFCSLGTEFNSPTSGMELCVYARCQNSTANAVTGCTHGTLMTSASGMKGCCSATPGKATPEWDCSGITDNDSADFYISLKQLSGGTNKCLPYLLNYVY
jgi:hypothetical protein